MNDDRISRRTFIRNTSLVAAASINAAVAGAGCVEGDKIKPDNKPRIHTSKILNYNPKMGYRRLDKAGLMVSEVSLGGHGPLGLTTLRCSNVQPNSA
jgi:hypothetical protein